MQNNKLMRLVKELNAQLYALCNLAAAFAAIRTRFSLTPGQIAIILTALVTT